MKSKLKKEDAAALDLLLDRSSAASGKAAGVYAPVNGVSRDRVRSAEKILSLLQWMPAADPPRDLVSQTLRRMGESNGTPIVAGPLTAHSPHHHA